MEPTKNSKQQARKELLDAISHVWNRGLSFIDSMALKCAVVLGISDVIKKHGKPMTLNELTNSLSIHPNKVSSLHQLMRLLVHSKIYAIQILATGEEAYDLTLNSELLLKDHSLTLAPLTRLGVTPFSTDPSHYLALWLCNQDQSCESPFQIGQGMHLYKGMPNDIKLNNTFNQAMASDSQLMLNLLLASDEFEGLIQGVESLLDVGGGNGTMAKVIAKAYPKLNFIVFDQPHVVNEVQVINETANLTYVAGDMFQAIPRAQVILLKWILHNWSDENCIKILKKCKEAIPSREKGGKLLIIDMVVGIPVDNVNHYECQLLADVHMMYLFGQKERTKQQWKSLFYKAGFCDYNILPILGSRSIIEVYPA